MRRWHGAAVVAVGVAALLSAAGLYSQRGYHTPTGAGVVPSTARLSPPTATTVARTTSRTTGQHTSNSRTHVVPHTRGAQPTRVVISSLDIDAPVVPVGVHDGAVDVPADAQELGWWSGGARAGASVGSVVVVGHVDVQSSGKGALYHLESVPIGTLAMVETLRGSVLYKIVGRRVYEKQALPSSVFATDGAPRLVLITCGGPFDRKTLHYADNVVVYGVPISA